MVKIDSHKRSIAKTISWRTIATVITALVAFAFTGEIALSLSIGFSDTLIKLLAYYLHERAWNKINFGRHIKSA